MKSVLITGGANGLGKQLSLYYAKNGYKICVLDLSVGENTENISYHRLDLAYFDVENLTFLKEPFDIVICNAGISVSGDFIKIDYEKELEVFEVNFFGHLRLMKFLLKNNFIKNEGRIAFICSASCFFSFPIALAYAASKSALDGFAHALESYLIDKKISVTRVYPGPMNTAHSQYYPGAATEGGRLPQQSVPLIVKAIEKRKRKICPDPISLFYRILSAFIPKLLAKKAFYFYQKRIR